MVLDIPSLQQKLEAEKTRLEEELGRIAQPTPTPGDYETEYENIGAGMEENASEVETYVDNLAVETNLEQQLKETNEALERIAKGTYGACEVCHEEIPAERLAAYPAARTCVRHAS